MCGIANIYGRWPIKMLFYLFKRITYCTAHPPAYVVVKGNVPETGLSLMFAINNRNWLDPNAGLRSFLLGLNLPLFLN